ncbi:MAG: lipopolysaccharide biosynthesis protein, partial [Spirochaeta sp.]
MISAFFRQVLRSTFLRNFSLLSAGTLISQAVLVLSSPILTRLFRPDDFGIQAVFVSIAGVITILFTLQYEMAIVLPREERKAVLLRRLAIRFSLIALVSAGGVSVLAWVTGLYRFAGGEGPGFVLIFSVVYAWILSYERVSNYTNIRSKRFARISLAVLLGSVIATAFFITGGFLWGGYAILLGGVILNHLVNVMVQNYGSGQNWRGIFFLGIRTEERKLLGEYREFPAYRMPQNLLNSLSQNLPSIILAGFFSPGVAGLYALARKIIRLPGLLVADALRKVYYQKASELHNETRPLFPSLLSLTLGLGAVGIIPFGLLVLFGPELFGFVFGAEWHAAGRYASWLSLWTWVGFANIPAVAVIPVLKLQKQNLWY